MDLPYQVCYYIKIYSAQPDYKQNKNTASGSQCKKQYQKDEFLDAYNKKLSYCWDSSRYDKISDSCRSANPNRKGKGLDTCYSATYMSRTRDQQRFTISEVAADWHEPMVPQRIMWPSIARANGQLDPRCS